VKKVYWRPRAVSRTALVLISLISIGGLLLVEFRQTSVKQPYFEEKLEAAQLAADCMEAIKQERLRTGKFIDPEIDPAQTGLIGAAMTAATSVSGILPAKQTSANPNFAAVIVEMLKKAGVESGDSVAIGYSGSFPALNICVAAAVEKLDLQPVAISSAAASGWGANLPDFLWLDMERVLRDHKLISFRSVAASIGGVEDRGLGMVEETRATLNRGIVRAGLPLLTADSFKEGVDKRMELYMQKAGGSRIAAYINVGGGTTSVGKSLGKRLLRSGLNTRLPPGARSIDSVMTRFLDQHVPVIHLVRVKDMATRYGLPVRTGLPDEEYQMPAVGTGQVFYRQEYNTWIAAAVLAMIMVCLYGFIRSDWGFRFFQLNAARHKQVGHPEPMV